MYILYAPSYPRSATPAQLAEAWREGGLALPDRVSSVAEAFRAALTAAGAQPVPGAHGDMEVPDDAHPLLQRLEKAYQALYPETRGSGRRDHFQYEQLEWLGQY